MSQIFNRQYRKLENSKESGIRTINHDISKRNILDGEIVISKPKNKPLKLSKKVDGQLWSVNFSNDGNQIVDKNLNINGDIISNGNLQLNNIPIFEAYSTGQTDLAVYASVPQIEFASENIDNTNSFASHNFVVPLKGYYHLYYNISFNQIDSAMTSAIIAMRIGGVTGAYFNVTRLDDKDYSADTDQSISKSASCVRSLDAGDTIGVYWLQVSGSAQVDVVAHREAYSTPYPASSVFGGYLISKY